MKRNSISHQGLTNDVKNASDEIQVTLLNRLIRGTSRIFGTVIAINGSNNKYWCIRHRIPPDALLSTFLLLFCGSSCGLVRSKSSHQPSTLIETMHQTLPLWCNKYRFHLTGWILLLCWLNAAKSCTWSGNWNGSDGRTTDQQRSKLYDIVLIPARALCRSQNSAHLLIRL